ncbi:uncharacterized protein LOC143577798 [Bidens hawaiensis]|uniref:uncharacterized protein LOC143577798 n=1 Tax=Bidens hawaiensis TaxID=980011 RepID=UPI00404ACA91
MVKVLKVWGVKDKNNTNEDFLIEMVFMDESGNRMQSTVFKQDIFRFKRYLNENATLSIVNPSLESNASNYKVIDYPNKLVLNSSTHVNPCNQFDGPSFGFKFYSFKSMIDKEIPLKDTIDNNSNMRDVKKNARLTMEVSYLSGDCVYVTLWGDYASQFSRPIPLKLMYTLDEEFLKATSFFNICEICTILQSIIVLGTIKANCPDSEWYYVGCNNCNRKLSVTVVEGNDIYECKNQRCNTLGVTPTPRYKIKLRVQDGSGVVSLTLFDRDAKLLINKTTSELLAIKDQDDVVDIGFPSELNSLLEKKFAFKVEIADFNFRNYVEVYGISKLIDDQQFISEIEKRLMHAFIVPLDSESLTFGNSLTDFQSTSSAYLKISENGDNQTPISFRLVDEEVNEIKLSSSDSDDKLKRKLVDVFDGDGQFGFSSTKSKTSDVQDDPELINVIGICKMYYPALAVLNQPSLEDMKIPRDYFQLLFPHQSVHETVTKPVEENTLRLCVFDSRGVERTLFYQQNIVGGHSGNVDIVTIDDDESFGVVDLEVDCV